MNANQQVNSLWIDPEIGDLQIMCIKSFLNIGVEYNLYTYNKIMNVPEGVILRDANEIIDRNLIFKDCKKSYATFSDWFRIKLLHEVGGWWVDSDVLCLKPFNFDEAYVFATEAFDFEGEKNVRICNAVIKMPKGSLIGSEVLSQIEDRLKKSDPEHIRWTEIGARMLADQITNLGLSDYVVIPEVFCPNDYGNFRELIDKADLNFDEETHGVHLWNKMWEWNNINPLQDLNKQSFLARKSEEYIKT